MCGRLFWMERQFSNISIENGRSDGPLAFPWMRKKMRPWLIQDTAALSKLITLPDYYIEALLKAMEYILREWGRKKIKFSNRVKLQNCNYSLMAHFYSVLCGIFKLTYLCILCEWNLMFYHNFFSFTEV